jgi:nitrogen PTS system EIIA component
MPISLPDILDERHVVLQLRARDREGALSQILDRLEKTESVREPERFLAQVLTREKSNSTLVENAVAFPHARTDLVDHITLAIGRTLAGIPWNEKGERAQLIFAFAVPQQLARDYLVIIGALARMTKDDARRQALFHAPTPAAFIEILREAPSF